MSDCRYATNTAYVDGYTSGCQEGYNTAIAESAKMRKALEFYADPKNWIDTPSWDGDPDCVSPKAVPVSPEDGRPCDCGDTARAALEGVKS